MSSLVLTGLLSSTSALSLSNFIPRIENLPSACQAVYVSEIENCTRDDFDFAKGATCSAPCVQGLVRITRAVERACGSVDVPETSVIGLFLLGQGIATVCPNIAVVTVTPSSAVRATSTKVEESTSSTKDSTTTTTSKEEEKSSTTATPSSSISTGGIAIDTTVPTTFSTTIPTAPPQPPSSVSPPQPATTTVIQKSNEDSGGGSPFDIVAGSSASLSPLRSLVIGTIVSAMAVAFVAL